MKLTSAIRIVIVDDHPVMLVGISAMIDSQADMQVVGQASTAAEAIDLHDRLRPDVMLLDLRLPDKNGVHVIRKLSSVSSSTRVIVFTTYEGDEHIHSALEAGARGYLIKGLPRDTLIEAIRKVHEGRRYLPQVVNNTLSSRLPGSNLTQRELDVLRLMYAGKSNREIAEELQIGPATVKTHVSVILSRLNVEDRTRAVVEALKRGLIHL